MPTSSAPTVLLDTNILLRLAEPTHLLHKVSRAAVIALRRQGATLCICPQNMQEYRQVATRPKTANGFGLTCEDVLKAIDAIEKKFILIPETPAIYPEWRRIAEAVGAIGRANFDARLAAVASASGISAILTFEFVAFERYAAQSSGLVILNPMTEAGVE